MQKCSSRSVQFMRHHLISYGIILFHVASSYFMRHHLTATATDSIGASSAGTSGFRVIVPVVAPPPAPPFAPCGKGFRV